MAEGDQTGKNPFPGQRLPDWLASVPMRVARPILVPVSDGKTVPWGLLISALTVKVGATVGSLSIAPELARELAQLSENADWMNLPAEPTRITRVDEGNWEIAVGDFTGRFDRATLGDKLREALHQPSENQETP
jgi:hypothetical protein